MIATTVFYPKPCDCENLARPSAAARCALPFHEFRLSAAQKSAYIGDVAHKSGEPYLTGNTL